MTSSRVFYRLFQWSVVPVGAALLGLASMQPLSLAQDTPPAGGNDAPAMENGQQVLTRGPVHEAFGQPTVFNPKPGLAITKKPPQPVEELPPDEKPEGDNVSWIGGYWSWDEEKNDFMWISGFWRVLPPGRQWMPGYWSDNAGQSAWVSGYWANAATQEQEVVDQAPPDSLEQGAPPTAPTQEHIWAPGCWIYRDTRYLWRPGYWVVNQPGWCWVPATYNWTPGGYIYVDGYWDHSVRRRGVLFAPCYFDSAVIYRPGYYYRPSVCLDIEVITPHFFCRPSYGHYYFGDYYATSYLSVGITPWFNFTYARGSRFYSSDFSYYECHYRRSNPRWGIEVRLGYERYRDNVAIRPARTYVNQQTVINNITINNNKTVVNNKTTIINNNTNNLALAKPIKTYTAAQAKNPDAAMKFEKINDTKAREFGKTATEVRKVGQERVAIERTRPTVPGKTGTTAGGSTAMRSVTLPKSPIVSRMPTTPNVDATKAPTGGNVGGQVTRNPPPIPEKGNRLPPVTGIAGTGAGNKTTGTVGGNTGGTTSGGKTMTGPGSGTVGGGTVSGGKTTTGPGSGTVGGSTGGTSSGGKTVTGPGSGTVGGGTSTGGKTTTGPGSGTVGGSTGGKTSSGPGTLGGTGGKTSGSTSSGTKSGGTSSGSKSGSSSSSSGGKKDKDKP